MVKAVKLLVASLSSSSCFITLYTSRTRSLRPIATTSATSAVAASNLRLHIARASSTSTHTHKMNSELYTFGPYKITPKEVFYSTDLCFAMVNLRPVVPGHVLVCPRREVKRFVDLTAEETVDMWLTAQKVGSRLENYHKASSLTLTIQDGPQAGQTVPHVHIHILPRKSGDFEKSDDAYDAIDEKEKELKQKLDLDKERKDRTLEEMSEEADEYRRLLS
ncbi:bifunctional bis(5'-adenosyl)-triphosphatase/adenylylsulfatase FHIT isoform X3 [Camellia sinensis]|uniref:bifunctional bis(5'-adenosyl)-triphosphatase/adenylylsulfatase FHIT isoform X2 n=1 Tax=Camellia sinensis TaxID=4442 RepID=UPI001036472E|nr:bifunctional bis(5'-adenosyl)-triphosphatase/adenylylsulfatase FHIT isoform X2 [Camellia sinensis]XP_028065791.1 bifunctional bis(5'-adenosyl)-triphosphatase/adenylylsulfatase FHIT isoform X3 [Camellia sinensis]